MERRVEVFLPNQLPSESTDANAAETGSGDGSTLVGTLAVTFPAICSGDIGVSLRLGKAS